jgi:hypothetical protein
MFKFAESEIRLSLSLSWRRPSEEMLFGASQTEAAACGVAQLRDPFVYAH